MSKTIEIIKGFKFAHRGCDVTEYSVGDVIENPSDDLYDIALKNKWAKDVKAKSAAPENKAAGEAPESKAE